VVALLVILYSVAHVQFLVRGIHNIAKSREAQFLADGDAPATNGGSFPRTKHVERWNRGPIAAWVYTILALSAI